MMLRSVRIILSIMVLLSFAACQQMGTTEYGVIFRRVPPIIGGGLSKHVARPGETVFLMPWDSIYRFDAKPKDVSWGAANRDKDKNDPSQIDFIYTRAKDGNELALAVTVRYRISSEPEKLLELVEHTATTEDEVRDLVIAVGRSDIRRYMNELPTAEFLDTDMRYKAVDKVRESMRTILGPGGIEIVQVNLDDFRFERQKNDGTIDASYQARLTKIQQLTQDTEREESRQNTVKSQKEQERAAVEALKNQMEAQADGYKAQAKTRSDAYYSARSNEAQAILAKGTAEAEGMVQQINALSGPGGEALLKLEIAKQLQRANPKFIVLGRGGSGASAIDLSKVDTNELLQQIGIAEALKDKAPESAPQSKSASDKVSDKEK